jgi:hypothetical protein
MKEYDITDNIFGARNEGFESSSCLGVESVRQEGMIGDLATKDLSQKMMGRRLEGYESPHKNTA